ncbi:hypothetical protein SDC9_163045 [bioreactor metagenome]|uniref:Uncharacterized protein n=1 Tax=bioreactor metagenome TaxID=1076179 RepID=A0A645FMU1_9ZZZZ
MSRLFQCLVALAQDLVGTVTGNGLDTADASSSATFTDNDECANITCLSNMGAATQLIRDRFLRVNGNGTHGFAVLFTKQSHCTFIHSLLE